VLVVGDVVADVSSLSSRLLCNVQTSSCREFKDDVALVLDGIKGEEAALRFLCKGRFDSDVIVDDGRDGTFDSGDGGENADVDDNTTVDNTRLRRRVDLDNSGEVVVMMVAKTFKICVESFY